MVFVQSWNESSSSLLVIVGLVLMFVICEVMSCLIYSQYVLFVLGIVMPLVVIFTITGMWSEEVAGPGLMEMLWKVLLFDRIMSGVVAALWE